VWWAIATTGEALAYFVCLRSAMDMRRTIWDLHENEGEGEALLRQGRQEVLSDLIATLVILPG
jgi:hypothetical protein